jgi:translation elongation factor EF-Ts
VVYYTSGPENVAKDIALQVAAMNPTYLSMDQVPQAEKDAVVS